MNRCDHCNRRLRHGDTITVTEYGLSATFHYGRRDCRIAAHEHPESTWTPPGRVGQMDCAVYGAALIGTDYIRWPWWLRWLNRVPDAWLLPVRRDIAMRVGGAVERGLAWQETRNDPARPLRPTPAERP